MDIFEELPPPGMRLATLEDQFYCGQLRYATWQKFVPIEPQIQMFASNRTYVNGTYWDCNCVGYNKKQLIDNWCPLCSTSRPEGLVHEGPVAFST